MWGTNLLFMTTLFVSITYLKSGDRSTAARWSKGLRHLTSLSLITSQFREVEAYKVQATCMDEGHELLMIFLLRSSWGIREKSFPYHEACTTLQGSKTVVQIAPLSEDWLHAQAKQAAVLQGGQLHCQGLCQSTVLSSQIWKGRLLLKGF